MKEDIKNVCKSDKTLTPADKTSNMYHLTKEQYNQLKRSAITLTYKKASIKIKEKVDKGGIKFGKDAGIVDRMQVNGTTNCFITLKDHKENLREQYKNKANQPRQK